MGKKKTVSAETIMTNYMEHVLEHHEQPKSVYLFAKSNQFDESQFYDHFGSFDAIEKHIFKLFFDNTLNVLNASEDYRNFDARNKLLSFYYTFFENLTANRSYVISTLKEGHKELKHLKVLSGLKNSFTKYIEELDIETLDMKQNKVNNFQKKALQESAWIQLLVTLKFWMEDTSAGFEKTDIFIEKSVNTSFDVLNVTPLKSVIDLGKFLFKETMHMN